MNSFIEFIKNQPQEVFFRILTSLLSMLIVPHIAIVMFIVYMSQNNFFSYDLFSEGLFGMKLFFTVTAFMIVFLGFMMTGSIGLFVVKIIKEDGFSIVKELKKGWGGLLVINLLVIMTTFLISYSTSNLIKLSYILFLSILINAHIWLIRYGKAKMQFFSLIFVTILIGYSTIFIFPKEASSLLEMGLKAFHIGGQDIIAEIKSKDEVSKGKLLLITPNYVFLKDENNSTYIFPMNNIEKIIVKKDDQIMPKESSTTKMKIE